MSNQSSLENQEATIEINNDLMAKIVYHSNVDQSILTITEDKTEIILRNYLKKIEQRNSWLTPFGIWISLIVIPITVENFKNAFFIPAHSWQTIVYLAIITSAIWLIISFIKSYRNRHVSIKDILKAMKSAEIH